MAFYISDFLVGATIAAVLFLKIKIVKSGEKTKDSFMKLLSIPTLLYGSMLFLNGSLHGIYGYLNIYLQEEMDAMPIIFSKS